MWNYPLGHERYRLLISGTNYPLGRVVLAYSYATKFLTVKFIKSNTRIIPCPPVKESPKPTGGEEEEQIAEGDIQLKISMRSLEGLAFPTALYEVEFPSGSKYWAFREELAGIPGVYRRNERIHVDNAQQGFLAVSPEGEKEEVSFQMLLSDGLSYSGETKLEPTGPPSEECTPAPPVCTEVDRQEQEESVALIHSEMCNTGIYPGAEVLSVFLRPVQACQCSTISLECDGISMLSRK